MRNAVFTVLFGVAAISFAGYGVADHSATAAVESLGEQDGRLFKENRGRLDKRQRGRLYKRERGRLGSIL